MYLRTIYELEEEGTVPLRARIAERLLQSGPTVSQTVARMERDGLLTVEGDRHIELSDEGREAATRVMRKHRLAECLLVNIIGLEWEQVHPEACRWEHVMSETVERRILEILDYPTESPFGNPIPGLAELGDTQTSNEVGYPATAAALATIADIMNSDNPPTRVLVRRIGEQLQEDTELMTILHNAGVTPLETIDISESVTGYLVGTAGNYIEIEDATSQLIFVDRI